MDFDNKELCQNLGELVMMKVAGELDADQFEACTAYMLKEAAAIPGLSKLDAIANYLRGKDWNGMVDTVAGAINKGIDAVAGGAHKVRTITDDIVASGENTAKLVERGKGMLNSLGIGAAEAPIVTPKTLAIGGAAGLGTFGLANLLSAAGNAKSYDPYEY